MLIHVKPLKYTSITAGKLDMQVGANLFVQGTGGATLSGAYRTIFNATTSFGGGVIAVEKISIGFEPRSSS